MSNNQLLLVIAIYFGVLIIGFTGLYYGVYKPTDKFYKRARILENDIKTTDNKDKQIIELFELSKLSWHRTTGEEIRMLAKMIEVKYNINLLK